MKKLLVIIALICFAVGTMAQNAYVTTPKVVNGWGTSADTLKASNVKSYVVMVKSPQLLKMQVVLRSDSVSGTPAYTALLMRSMDGVHWVAFDTLTLTGGASKYGEYTAVSATYNYYKVQVTATSATQKSNLFVYFNFRKE